MSKHFGGGGRRLEGHGHGHKDYPRRGGGEDKRPSVFDRLGVRKYEDNLQSSHSHSHSSHSHYGGGSGGTDSGGYRRNDGRDVPGGMRKHSPMQGPAMSNRRHQPEARERMRSRSRSRSFSPRPRKVPLEVSHHQTHHHGHPHAGGHPGHGHGHGHMSLKKSKLRDISPHDHRMRQRSNSPMRRKAEKPVIASGSSPKWREDNPPMGRHKGGLGGGHPSGKGKKGSGKRSSKKAGKERKSGGVKGRSSSGTSGSSGETSSSSRSASSSSTTSEASSSTTSNLSTSSDSSVPSIKLRHDKQKRKKPKRPSSKSESVSTGQIQSRISSGSSIESGNIRDNRDLREKIKAKTRQNYERMQDGTPPEIRQQRRQAPQDQYSSGGSRSYSKPDMRDESPGSTRRRRSSGTPSFDEKPLKRRRILSPDEFVPSPRRAPPNDPTSSSGSHQMRRERSPPPLPRDRIRVIQSPMRRAPAEDSRRGDIRPDMSKRLDNYGEKPREGDRYRDEGSYGRDIVLNRQKERLAPARPTSSAGRHPHPMTPTSDRDRDRGLLERPGPSSAGPLSNYKFDSRNNSRPLLQLPHGATPELSQKMPHPHLRQTPDDRVSSRVTIEPPQISPGPPKHSPMIVKSKEALIEKYRGMKQSQYVDMWVDKTLHACAPPGSSIVSPPKDTPTDSSRPFDDSAEAGAKNVSMKDMEDLLSDFSDDADELLNDVGDDPKSEKSEKDTSMAEKSKVLNTAGAGEYETEIASTATTTETPTTPAVIDKKPAQSSTVLTTASVLSSHERKSLGTPQRSFAEVGREGQSLPSRSQTEDDILERMDFEEISDEELGDVGSENKIPIVDALGVDWASLVCGEKNRPVSPSSALTSASTSMMKVRKRWSPLQVISRVGLIKNCSERLLQKVTDMKMKEEQPYSDNSSSAAEDPLEQEERIQDELLNAGKFRKMRARSNVIDTIGLGPNSRALSSRRDMALRRYYLGMPQKSLVSMDWLHQNSASNTVQDLESIGELYRLSLSLFKGSESAAVSM